MRQSRDFHNDEICCVLAQGECQPEHPNQRKKQQIEGNQPMHSNYFFVISAFNEDLLGHQVSFSSVRRFENQIVARMPVSLINLVLAFPTRLATDKRASGCRAISSFSGNGYAKQTRADLESCFASGHLGGKAKLSIGYRNARFAPSVGVSTTKPRA
ncbi:unnamed protein product [Protopolystoma xenopodis]|uniref:Uncharacterized protein n=1 Tax=Protopolystoma xenopodis TaxID=117903 RepID=A0A3S5B6K5_9PLAT|nr:unnamed protein product [Protopolystoma xenopodis]